MSKDLEIKCPSGATISFIGEDSGESFKGLADAKLLRSLEEYNNTDHGEDFEEFDLFEKQSKVNKQYSSKQRKLHKLKRINCVLGQKRRRLITVAEGMFLSGKFNIFTVNSYGCNVAKISEKIGKNSTKIQRLRTQIQQEKSLSDKFYAAVKELQETLREEEHSKLSYFEEIELMGDVAEEAGVLYQHPIDKDCYVFRDESGFVMKAPKAIVDHPNLKEILNEHSSGA